MTERNRRIVLATVMVAAAGIAACTNSDPLAPQPGNVEIILKTQPGGAAGFDNFNMALTQVGFKPVGPNAQTSFGPVPIGTLTGQLGVNFAQSAERSLGTLALPAGEYQVDQISLDFTLSPAMFQEFTPALPPDPCNASNCLRYVTYRNSSLSDPSDPDSPRFNGRIPAPEIVLANPAYRITDITTLPPFQIGSGQAARVKVVINGDQLAQKMLAGYSCTCVGTCAGNVPAPCLSNFIKPPASEIASLISVE